MFTGIISGKAVVRSMPTTQVGRFILEIIEPEYFLAKIKLGDSISVNGICLTVVEFNQTSFAVDVSPETIARTNFKTLQLNQEVNLEHALKLGDSLDGHLVQGHVDGVVIVTDIINVQNNQKLILMLDNTRFIKYIAEKGSVTLNGVSLTVNEVLPNGFTVNIIPHTLEQTNLMHVKIGDILNLEIDLLARYCVNFLEIKDKGLV
jgi:riboflavin synthase